MEIIREVENVPEAATSQEGNEANNNDKEATNHVAEPAEAITNAQSRRLLLKTDLVVLPLIVISMTLAFLDKVSRLGPLERTGLDQANTNLNVSCRTRSDTLQYSTCEKTRILVASNSAGSAASSI